MNEAVRARGLRAAYAGREVLHGVDLEVRAGEIVGLLGADGAGKTTCLHLLAGIKRPASGELLVLGRSAERARGEIGYLTQRASLPGELSVDENLAYAAGLRRVDAAAFRERRERYLALMELAAFRERRAAELSGGMRQKLALCCALVAEPRLLLLDEPTTGIDPVARREFWAIAARLAEAGTAIVVATPYVDEGERCRRVALVHRGLFVASGTPAELRGDAASLERVFAATLGTPPAQPAAPAVLPARRGAAIEVRGLVKRFGAFTAVDGATFTVDYGEIYGLLGANGAGKTTIIKAICGLVEPTAGSVALAGRSADRRSVAMRRRLGYVSQRSTLYEDLSVRENLDYYASVYGLRGRRRAERIAWALETCGLGDAAGTLVAALPGGLRQRVAFGAAVMHEPEILFLDEPTSGVDAAARTTFWQLIGDVAARGSAVLVTTHHLDEAEHCARVCFLAAGRVVAEGTPRDLKARERGTIVELRCARPQAALEALAPLLPTWRASLYGERLHLVLDAPEELPAIRERLRPFDASAPAIVAPTLEDAFVRLVHEAA